MKYTLELKRVKENEIKCEYCNHNLPNKEMKLGKKCLWCDIDYHYTKQKNLNITLDN